jgi:hypothetical protein
VKSGKSGRFVVAKTAVAYGSDAKKSIAVGRLDASVLWPPNIGLASLRLRTISSKALWRKLLSRPSLTPPFFFSYFVLHLVFNCTLSFRASSKGLRSFHLVGAGLIF